MGRVMETEEERFTRFMSKVAKSDTGCWIWTGNKTPKGYGEFYAFDRSIRAHRFMFEAVNAPIPDGLLVCHSCDVRDCVNPEHLWLGTIADNNKDMFNKGRYAGGGGPRGGSKKTHCPSGHPYEGDNVYIRKNGSFKCRTCHRVRTKEKRMASKHA